MREAVLARAGSRWRTRNTTAGRSRTAPPSADQAAAARNIVRCRHGTAPSRGRRIETRARLLARLSEALDRHRASRLAPIPSQPASFGAIFGAEAAC